MLAMTTNLEQEATLQLDGVYCTGCADAVERALRAELTVTQVHLDWGSNIVHVRYRADQTNLAALEHLITTTGCACAPAAPGAQTNHSAAHDHAVAPPTAPHPEGTRPPESRRLQHLAHAVDVQPITMGTKYDRLQYEMPTTAAHAHHHPTPAPAGPAAAPVDPAIHGPHGAGGSAPAAPTHAEPATPTAAD